MPRSTSCRPFASTALLLCIWPLESQANVGVPLFFNFVLYSWLLLVPVIGIEAYVLRKRLTVSVARASGVASLANIVSTIVGTIVVFGVSLLLGVAADMLESPGAMGDVTVLFALIPCFFLSVWIESLVGAPLLAAFSRQDVRRVFYQANAFSYAMLAILPIARLAKNAIVQGQIVW